MQYAETVVNVPIRRTFSRRYAEPPPEPFDADQATSPAATPDAPHPGQTFATTGQRGLQTFHYHIPAALETTLRPGHLVWAPFGRQEVQGVVVRLSDHAPVATKPIARLVRPEPVLTAEQLRLAAWIADYYIAPFSEAIKLFLPPGLLTKRPDAENSKRARAKRELQVELLADAATIAHRLPHLGRDSQQASVLAWLIDHPQQAPTCAELQEACGLKSPSAIHSLAAKQLVSLNDSGATQAERRVQLAPSPAAATQALITLRGADQYEPVLDALLAEQRPLWKSELYERVETDLRALRVLQKAGLLQLTEKVRFRDPLAGRTYPRTTAPPLTEEQTRAWRAIEERGCARLFATNDPASDQLHAYDGMANSEDTDAGASRAAAMFLLHGVTGSGKTEIYLRAIERTLAANRQAIVLVPEIALTPQTVARFAGRFPDRVTVIHSGLSQGERYDVWRRVRDGEFDVVIGPRSALFAPLSRLGLIVVDEEHEPSYKQSAEAWGSYTVFYDARAVARRLAELTGSLLILGSATPSLESYCQTQPLANGECRLILLDMLRRVMGHHPHNEPDAATPPDVAPRPVYAELPPVELVDMRQELHAGNRSILSRSLQAALHATLDADEQAILFLNRRGTHTFVMCRDCGDVQKCTRCDLPLTYHERVSVLVCHHCNQRAPIPSVCPACDSKRIKYFGSGTQRLEELVTQIAPRARVLRWDADTTGRKGSHEALLRRFAERKADVMVGTQMVAKGLDLPMVTLVGVIAADTGLYLPDFRSAERTFQLLTQVAGRAGRSTRSGRVIIQTYTPGHYAIQAAAHHDYQTFFEREMAFRAEHAYPPVQRMVRLIYWDKKLEKVQEASESMAANLRHRLQQMGADGATIDLMGPTPAFFARFRNYYRWQILLRGPDPTAPLRGLSIPFGWRVDVDPITVL